MRLIVCDVGCHTHRDDDSVGVLIERFGPDRLYGFDPYSHVVPGERVVNGTRVIIEQSAAWTRGGTIEFVEPRSMPTHSTVMNPYEYGEGMRRVACFDLADWIESHGLNADLILKLDVEGAEYDLLEHLYAREADRYVTLLLVEWHPLPPEAISWATRVSLMKRLRCPVEGWH